MLRAVGLQRRSSDAEMQVDGLAVDCLILVEMVFLRRQTTPTQSHLHEVLAGQPRRGPVMSGGMHGAESGTVTVLGSRGCKAVSAADNCLLASK